MKNSEPTPSLSPEQLSNATDGELDAAQVLASARATLQQEAQALMRTAKHLDQSFVKTVQLLLACQGRVVVTGLGKSGHIGRKIAATLASTGTPAVFIHSAEAVHGDLGMITAKDVVLAISYSGQSNELAVVLPVVRRLGAPIIALCGNAHSDLAQLADVFLDGSIEHEACPLNLAPTTSTTVALALGDALAIACLQARNFTANDFARSHPGGALGRRLLTYVKDIMRVNEAIPKVSTQAYMPEVLNEISSKGMGMTAVLGPSQELAGVFTDGDLRRLIEKKGDIRHYQVADVMTSQPRTIRADALAIEAAGVMERHKLSNLLVIDQQQHLVGALHMHDLMAAKVI
ncbi:KpsF/GutQ family sugar-phosphate isomerase [Brackiella oedipodis]|uniref:KpsF/GutQ family sugar-phosphate isomerase n=1 Tax=Brackiella oedipodis TaxID=124225 RepID=UPI000A057DF5|nr:KpsF/GutQ family sugar-phosphate isomerase [Brackiella oedipodis]